MKKGYYLYTENYGSCGVKKKVEMQIGVLSRYFDIEGLQIKTSKQNVLRRIAGVTFWGSYERQYDEIISKIVRPDFIYIRKSNADRKYLEFIGEIRRKFPKCKIIMEIPTYPYDGEMLSNWYTTAIFLREVYYRKKFKKFIDRFVTFSDDKCIFGVPTIRTMNGINVDEIPVLCQDREYNPNCINMIAVALFARHHGYERIISGMNSYYQSNPDRKIVLHLVGNGRELGKYRRLVKKYELNNYVIFHGEKRGTDLEKLYSIADVGLAAFGVYKDGFSKLSTLKAREYLAKGIPVVLGAEDDLFDNSEYGLIYPNNNTEIDMNRIVLFLDELYGTSRKKDIACNIREFAKRKADNVVTLQPIIEYISNNEQVY